VAHSGRANGKSSGMKTGFWAFSLSLVIGYLRGYITNAADPEFTDLTLNIATVV
jgi:hypothetical protein